MGDGTKYVTTLRLLAMKIRKREPDSDVIIELDDVVWDLLENGNTKEASFFAMSLASGVQDRLRWRSVDM